MSGNELKPLGQVGRVSDFQACKASFKVEKWQEQTNDRVGLQVPDDVASLVSLSAGAKVKVTVWGSRNHTVTGFFEDILVAGEGNMLLMTIDQLKRLNYPESLEVRIVEVFVGLSTQESAVLEQAMAEFDESFDNATHARKLAKYDEYIEWFKEEFLRNRIMDDAYELGEKDIEELLSFLDFTAHNRREGFGFFRIGLAHKLWYQMVEDPSRFKETVKHLLLSATPLEQRINEIMNQERFRIKNFQGQNLIPITALLLSTNRDAYIHILSMSHKKRKLEALGMLPTLGADAGSGERFIAYDKALLSLRERFKLRWDARKLSLFLYSDSFIRAFEKKARTSISVLTGLSRALVWIVNPSDCGFRGACRAAEQNRLCPASAQEKLRCSAGFGCDSAYSLRDRVIPLPDAKGFVPVLGEAVFMVAPSSGGGHELKAVLVARERGSNYPLRLENGDVRYLEHYVRASPDYLIDLTDRPLAWTLDAPDTGFSTISGSQAVAVLKNLARAIAGDGRVDVLLRCYQGLEDPGITTERIFDLDDFMHFIHSEAGGRFHFPERDILNYHSALRTKPFVILTGLSGTGKTKIAQLYAQFMTGQDVGGDRYEIISVRPDWMDNKGLLGFYNVLTERYQSTPFLDILLRAHRHPTRRYYVILDEMNLAKVEYYFSDFLSAMESGERIELHGLEQDAIKAGADNDVSYEGIPSGVRVPRNLFFTGTVNIDETTYMFSPKVLDRANTIEFNRVELERYFRLNPSPGLEGPMRVLVEMNAMLARYEMHFGYRVAGEIMGYLRHARQAGMAINSAFDLQIKQKVLPKFHGSRGKLEDALVDLLVLTTGKKVIKGEDGERELDRLVESLTSSQRESLNATFPESAGKIARMLRDLRRDGFVSFA